MCDCDEELTPEEFRQMWAEMSESERALAIHCLEEQIEEAARMPTAKALMTKKKVAATVAVKWHVAVK